MAATARAKAGFRASCSIWPRDIRNRPADLSSVYFPERRLRGADGGAPTIGAINVVTIPSGTFLSPQDCVKFSQPLLQIEAEAIASLDAEPEPKIEAAEPAHIEAAQRRAELNTMSVEQLMALAGVVADVDQS